jgi:hypothetical protein
VLSTFSVEEIKFYVFYFNVNVSILNDKMNKTLKELEGPDVTVQVYNPSYLRSRDQEDYGLRPFWAKSMETLISNNKLGMVVHACHPSYVGGIGLRLAWAKR